MVLLLATFFLLIRNEALSKNFISSVVHLLSPDNTMIYYKLFVDFARTFLGDSEDFPSTFLRQNPSFSKYTPRNVEGDQQEIRCIPKKKDTKKRGLLLYLVDHKCQIHIKKESCSISNSLFSVILMNQLIMFLSTNGRIHLAKLVRFAVVLPSDFPLVSTRIYF